MSPMPEINRTARGHRFYPIASDKIPPLYAQDALGEDAVVRLHYFGGPVDIYVTEYDPKTGEAFGWVCLGDLQNAEWGYIDLPAYESATFRFGCIERDRYFTPGRARDILPKGR